MASTRTILVCLLVSVLSACGGGSGDPPQSTTGETDILETTSSGTVTSGEPVFNPIIYATPDGIAQCSVDDIKSRVDFDMRDYYIYYDSVPTLNLADYDSANALIRDLRVSPDIFSSVDDAATQSALFGEGETSGYGFGFQRSTDNIVRFRNIDGGSPADSAGIVRGDELITLNGIAVDDLTNEAVRETLGPDTTAAVTMTIRTADEEPRTVSVAQAQYRWKTVGTLNRFTPSTDQSLPTIGYIPIRVFLSTTKNEIDNALQILEDNGGVDELIVDLRYNGGGQTSVAQYLASVVGGAAVEGQVLLENRWNDKYEAFSDTELFAKVDKPLNSPRVFVLTTGSTASSSEIFINSLKPYLNVVVIGETTAGKPFTSRPRTYCDKSINAMISVRFNAAGVSVEGGIAPDCRVADSWNTVAFKKADPLVAAALDYAGSGSCNTTTVEASDLQRSTVLSGPSYWPRERANFALGN